MNTPAHDLALYVVDQLGLKFGGNKPWSVHVGGEPAEPANVITFYDVGGGEPDTDEQDVTQPSIQVRVRSKDYSEAYAKQELIRDILIRPGLSPVIIAETSRFTGVMMTSDFLSLGKDENNLNLWTANYRSRRTKKE